MALRTALNSNLKARVVSIKSLQCSSVAEARSAVVVEAQFFGIAAAPEAGTAGTAGTAAGAGTAPPPGICAAPVSGTLAAGALDTGRSSTLPVGGRERSLDSDASAKVQTKKTAAHTAVEREDRKSVV